MTYYVLYFRTDTSKNAVKIRECHVTKTTSLLSHIKEPGIIPASYRNLSVPWCLSASTVCNGSQNFAYFRQSAIVVMSLW
jgi:hypothetical protein